MNLTELEDRLQMTFPKDKLEEILYHESYRPQDSHLIKKNKEYISWGRIIAQAAYSIYLYQNDRNISRKLLSLKITDLYKDFENDIFRKYRLEDFVLKDDAELNNFHLDIVPKLLVLMYQHYGFIKVYNFLLPLFESSMAGTNIDYKALLQEYAQRNKLSPIYQFVDTIDSNHEKKYKCKITVGKMIAIGEAVGKKHAEKEAEKEFVEKYKANLIKQKVIENENKQIWVLYKRRKKKLDISISALHLNHIFISYRQIDEVLTHSSYVNEHHNQGYSSNASISVVGDNILSMLCVEYIFENYDISIVDIETERKTLLQIDNLSKSIPDRILNCILTSKSLQIKKRNMSVYLKIDVLKSVIGMLWVNYISKNDDTIAKFVKGYAYKVIAVSEKEKGCDPRKVLQNITQNFGWSYTNECGIKRYNADDIVFVSTITIKGAGWEENGRGSGGTKVLATKVASKNALLKLASRCAENKSVECAMLKMFTPELLSEYETLRNLKSQMIEKTMDNSVISKQKLKNVNPYVVMPAKPKPIEKEQEVPKEVSFDGPEHVLYVCKGTISCRNEGHKIVSSTGILPSLGGRPVKININYCQSCKLFFISLTEYKHYQELYGILLGNISIRQNIESNGNGYTSLADESILRICGYSVNQIDDLSTEQRRIILGNLMDHDIISKYRIIEYLQFFINNSKHRNNMRSANQKWSDDLQWVRSYNIDRQRKYIITTLKKWK